MSSHLIKLATFLVFVSCLCMFGACDKEDDSGSNSNTNINNNNNNTNNNNSNTNTNNNNNNNWIDNFLGCYDVNSDCGTIGPAKAEIRPDSISSNILIDLRDSVSVSFNPDFYAVVNNDTQFFIPQQLLQQSGTNALVHCQGWLRNDSLIIYTFLNSSSMNNAPCNYFMVPTICQ